MARVNVHIDERAMMAKALKSFKDAGDFDPAIREWEVRPTVVQTYANLKVLMCTEYSKLNRQDTTTARAMGHASANNIVEKWHKQQKNWSQNLPNDTPSKSRH